MSVFKLVLATLAPHLRTRFQAQTASSAQQQPAPKRSAVSSAATRLRAPLVMTTKQANSAATSFATMPRAANSMISVLSLLAQRTQPALTVPEVTHARAIQDTTATEPLVSPLAPPRHAQLHGSPRRTTQLSALLKHAPLRSAAVQHVQRTHAQRAKSWIPRQCAMLHARTPLVATSAWITPAVSTRSVFAIPLADILASA